MSFVEVGKVFAQKKKKKRKFFVVTNTHKVWNILAQHFISKPFVFDNFRGYKNGTYEEMVKLPKARART